MQGILLHLLTAALYAGLWLTCWRSRSSPNSSRYPVMLTLLAGLICHALVLGLDLFEFQNFRFGLINALSLTMWLAMFFYALESTLRPLDGLLIFASPAASIAGLLPAILDGHPLIIPLTGWLLKAHIIAAMTAYSLFTLAAFHAILMVIIEKSLHGGSLLGTWEHFPPLLTLERLLFKLIGTAFLLLTITVCSGVFFSEQIFGTPFELNHKSVFSVLAWAVFGALIAGRALKGWRGRIALRWTVFGLLLMLLAYAGSRFVLEFILGRSS